MESCDKHNHQEGYGVIGITKKKPAVLARNPSAIYWNGISTYGFIQTGGLSQDAFLRNSTGKTVESILSAAPVSDDESTDDPDLDHENIFRIKIPRKKNWSDELDLELDAEEAEYFRDRIKEKAGEKLVGRLAQNEPLWNLFEKAADFRQFSQASRNVLLQEGLRAMLDLAHDFSVVMYGAHIAYNGLLQKMKFGSNAFQETWDAWRTNLHQEMIDPKGFDPNRLFTLVGRSSEFVKQWWSFSLRGFQDHARIEASIRDRESLAKGVKARILKSKLEDVSQGKWIGLTYLDYRFSNAKTILRDIYTGLSR